MKRHFGSILMLSAAFASGLSFYVVTLKVSAERVAVEGLRGAIASDVADIERLQAELRTRARMPELQRWNDEVLALSAPAPAQYATGPLALVSARETAVEAATPAAQPTLLRELPAVMPATRPPLVVASAVMAPLLPAPGQAAAPRARPTPIMRAAATPSAAPPELARLIQSIDAELAAAPRPPTPARTTLQ